MDVDDIIDVDALPSGPLPSPSTGLASGAPVNEIIDVDKPDTWTRLAPSSVAGPSGTGLKQPAMKFDGELGRVLYEQKTEVLEEEAATARATSAAADAVSTAAPFAASSPVAAARRVGTLGEAVVAARAEIVAERAAKMNMAWPPMAMGSSAAGPSATPDANLPPHPTAGGSAGLAVSAAPANDERASPRPLKMARVVGSVASVPNEVAMPTVRRGRSRSKWDDKLRHPRKAFVRKAAVMTVVPRIIAGPPTPAPSGTESGPGEHESGSGAGHGTDNDGLGSVDGFDADVSGDGGGECGDEGDHDGEVSADQDAVEDADDAEDGTVVPGSEKRNVDDAAAIAAAAAASDALAWQLATNSRNPRLFPATCWIPGAHAVLAAARVSHDGLPPIAPAATPGSVPVGMHPIQSQETAPAPPPMPSLSMQAPVVVETDEDSSDEMDDDALVMAYVTPPASPAPVITPTASPMLPRSSSGKRRRANDSRSMRAAASAAAAAAGGASGGRPALQSDVLLRNLYDAVRNGFSSVRREMTRMRAEVVIAKSQAASTLRRMDGIAAAVDARDVGTGEVLGRLGDLDKALRDISVRITSSSPRGSGDQATGKDSLALMVEIKVRSIIFDVLLRLIRLCDRRRVSCCEE